MIQESGSKAKLFHWGMCGWNWSKTSTPASLSPVQLRVRNRLQFSAVYFLINHLPWLCGNCFQWSFIVLWWVFHRLHIITFLALAIEVKIQVKMKIAKSENVVGESSLLHLHNGVNISKLTDANLSWDCLCLQMRVKWNEVDEQENRKGD